MSQVRGGGGGACIKLLLTYMEIVHDDMLVEQHQEGFYDSYKDQLCG